MAEALLLELEFPALLSERARRTEACEKAVGGAVALDGVPGTSQLASAHTNDAAAAETLRQTVHYGLVADDTLHGVLADRRVFERLVPGTVTAVRNARKEPGNDTGEWICEAVKDAVRPFTLAVDHR